MLGLKRGEVKLFPHEKQWETEAERIIEKLRFVLGSAVFKIEHVGSTSIETIAAKPIIDIAAEAESFESVVALKDELQKNGFYLRDCGLENQLLLACGSFYDGTGDRQTAFVHVVKRNGKEWNDYIKFRNYLRKYPFAAREYEKLKLELSKTASQNDRRKEYTNGKKELIEYFLRKALVDSYLGKTVKIKVDRPIGYVHKKENYSLIYPINYGYIPGVIGGDGEELDVYLLGVDEPVLSFTAKVIAVVHRKNDVEDKLVAAPPDRFFTEAEIASAVAFQERYFESCIQTP